MEAGPPQRRRGRDMSGDTGLFETFDERAHVAEDVALMQPASMAFLRLSPALLDSQICERMTPAEQIRKWMKETLASTGMGPGEWADKAGIAKSTVFRAMKDDYQFVTSSRTLAKLASAAGVSPPGLAAPSAAPVTPMFLPVRYEPGAGLWRLVEDAQVFLGTYPVAPDPAFAGFPQWLERPVGDSMDLEYRQGELLHVVDAIEMGYAPRPGDHVILVRRRAGGQEVERTVKEVAFGPGGRVEFWPRSTNPRWREPLVLDAGRWTDEVEVVGLVIGSYRPRG